MRLQGWPRTSVQAAILRDARKNALLGMRSARVDTGGGMGGYRKSSTHPKPNCYDSNRGNAQRERFPLDTDQRPWPACRKSLTHCSGANVLMSFPISFESALMVRAVPLRIAVLSLENACSIG